MSAAKRVLRDRNIQGQTPSKSAFSRGRQKSNTHDPLGDQANTGKGVADVTQESILVRKCYAVEALARKQSVR